MILQIDIADVYVKAKNVGTPAGALVGEEGIAAEVVALIDRPRSASPATAIDCDREEVLLHVLPFSCWLIPAVRERLPRSRATQQADAGGVRTRAEKIHLTLFFVGGWNAIDFRFSGRQRPQREAPLSSS